MKNMLNLWALLDILDQNKIKKDGKNYTMLCPWHDEKTPSLAISYDNDDKEAFYHCFGCGKHGHLEEIAFPTKGSSKIPLRDYDPYEGVKEMAQHARFMAEAQALGLKGLSLLLLRSSVISSWDEEYGVVQFVLDPAQKELISERRIEEIRQAVCKFCDDVTMRVEFGIVNK